MVLIVNKIKRLVISRKKAQLQKTSGRFDLKINAIQGIFFNTKFNSI